MFFSRTGFPCGPDVLPAGHSAGPREKNPVLPPRRRPRLDSGKPGFSVAEMRVLPSGRPREVMSCPRASSGEPCLALGSAAGKVSIQRNLSGIEVPLRLRLLTRLSPGRRPRGIRSCPKAGRRKSCLAVRPGAGSPVLPSGRPRANQSYECMYKCIMFVLPGNR